MPWRSLETHSHPPQTGAVLPQNGRKAPTRSQYSVARGAELVSRGWGGGGRRAQLPASTSGRRRARPGPAHRPEGPPPPLGSVTSAPLPGPTAAQSHVSISTPESETWLRSGALGSTGAQSFRGGRGLLRGGDPFRSLGRGASWRSEAASGPACLAQVCSQLQRQRGMRRTRAHRAPTLGAPQAASPPRPPGLGGHLETQWVGGGWEDAGARPEHSAGCGQR